MFERKGYYLSTIDLSFIFEIIMILSEMVVVCTSSTMPVTIVRAHGLLLDLPHIASWDWVFFSGSLESEKGNLSYRRPPFSCTPKTQQSPSGVYMMKFRPCFPVSRMVFFHSTATPGLPSLGYSRSTQAGFKPSSCWGFGDLTCY